MTYEYNIEDLENPEPGLTNHSLGCLFACLSVPLPGPLGPESGGSHAHARVHSCGKLM